jgi:hypothetical protein
VLRDGIEKNWLKKKKNDFSQLDLTR